MLDLGSSDSGFESRRPDMTKFGWFYIVWAALVIALTFSKPGLPNEHLTHFLVLVILGAVLLVWRIVGKRVLARGIRKPRRFFVLWSVLLASLVEGTYMISDPFAHSKMLILSAHPTLGEFLAKYAIDLALTVPFYTVLFFIVWRLINRYQYSVWEYVFLIAFAQAVGDGGPFFFLAPWMLLLIPYTMMNYQAMSVVPFLAVRPQLALGKVSRWKKYVVTIVTIVLTYFVLGAILTILGKIIFHI